MRSRSRLEALERKTDKAGAPIFVWCEQGETEGEAWQKEFGDQPMPEGDLVICVQWSSNGEPKKRGLLHNDQ